MLKTTALVLLCLCTQLHGQTIEIFEAIPYLSVKDTSSFTQYMHACGFSGRYIPKGGYGFYYYRSYKKACTALTDSSSYNYVTIDYYGNKNTVIYYTNCKKNYKNIRRKMAREGFKNLPSLNQPSINGTAFASKHYPDVLLFVNQNIRTNFGRVAYLITISKLD